MGKGDVISWGLILGGLAALGYLGYQGVKSIMGNGLFSSTRSFGGEEVKVDIFGNIPAGTQQEVISGKVAALSEQSIQAATNLAKMDAYGPEMAEAYAAYTKELNEYNEAAKAYEHGLAWVENPFSNIAGGGGAGSSSLYPWNWGKPTVETQRLYDKMEKERLESQAAGKTYTEIRAKWMAQNA